MNNIIDVHISRRAAGVVLPFDKMYLIHKDDREYIPKIFGYALVLPLSDQITEPLSNIRPRRQTHKGFRRDDDRKDLPIFKQKTTKSDWQAWWGSFLTEHDAENRVVVIPILTASVRKQVRPRYLVAKHWEANAKARRGSQASLPLLSDYAYLATPLAPPDDKIRPICSICPRMLLQLQGKCQPGERICYESLDFAEIGRTSDASV